MPLTKFKTWSSSCKITPTEVLRETDKSVFFKAGGMFPTKGGERRESKFDSYSQYHDTWSDAHDFLMKREAAKVAEARRRLELASGSLGNVKGMKQEQPL